MEYFQVKGGNRLSGEITPQGAKNEALQILCAVLLTSEPVNYCDGPSDIVDVNRLIDIIRDMGVKVEQLAPDTYRFQADAVDTALPPDPEFWAKARKLRAGQSCW